MAARKRDEFLNEKLDELDKRMDQCRTLYELWFNGIEKREPLWYRQEILREITRILRLELNNAVDRFRFRNIQARFNAMVQYWNRICFQRERGSYHKDLHRMRRRMGSPKEDKAKQTTPSEQRESQTEHPKLTQHKTSTEPLHTEKTSTQTNSTNIEPQNSPSTNSLASSATQISEERVQKIYRTYLKAKERCRESTEDINYEGVANSLKQQVQRLQERGYRDIDFQVVIHDGKAAIKPVGKKQE
jgi:hypothetical protein